jgi:hypothetical protein
MNNACKPVTDKDITEYHASIHTRRGMKGVVVGYKYLVAMHRLGLIALSDAQTEHMADHIGQWFNTRAKRDLPYARSTVDDWERV